MSWHRLQHSNTFCYFRERSYRYIRENLTNWSFLSAIKKKYGFCKCYEYALVRANPDMTNASIEEEDFIDMAINAGYFYNGYKTKYTYNCAQNKGMVYIDDNVGSLLKEFKPDIYKNTFRYSKTPKAGRMYFALLGYLYPEVHPSKNQRFQLAYEMAIDEFFKNVDPYKPDSLTEVISAIPKTTSAGFIALRKFGQRLKKEEVLGTIASEYKRMKYNVSRNRDYENYTMYAARGHLSEKTKLKTRPIWMQSAETVVAELRYANGLYRQFNKKWFRDRMIHGEGSMKRLRQYLGSEADRYFCNTDISGWDAFRPVFLHRRFFSELKKKIIMDDDDSKLYDFINYKSNIYGRILLPSGYVYKTNGGLFSGSGFTLAQNTALNMILCITILIMMGDYTSGKIVRVNWLGDDFSIITTSKFDLKRFSEMLMRYFGLEIKVEKCFEAAPNQDRKFLGYEIRGGLLFKNLDEIWPGILYTEKYFKKDFDSIAKSFTRLFSYLILGGINHYEYYEFFMLFLGKYGTWLDKVEYIFDDSTHRIMRVLKDIYNIQIGKFNSESFKKMSLYLSKYILLYDYDLLQVDKLLIKDF